MTNEMFDVFSLIARIAKRRKALKVHECFNIFPLINFINDLVLKLMAFESRIQFCGCFCAVSTKGFVKTFVPSLAFPKFLTASRVETK